MINISDIERFYPENQKPFKRNILREYLQYKILNIIFDTEYASRLSFMGGTCLRIIFGTNRFSEDLDFDNTGLTADELDFLSEIIAKKLEDEGYQAEIKTVHKGAFRCYIKMPGLLYGSGLSGFREEKILIQLDTEPQQYDYRRESFLLNRFDVFTRIYYTPVNILLSQKLWAVLNRKTPKGRDYYDVIFLFGLTQPDYGYLEKKAGVTNLQELKIRLMQKLEMTDTSTLVKDVEPFLIQPDDSKRIELFPEFVRGLSRMLFHRVANI